MLLQGQPTKALRTQSQPEAMSRALTWSSHSSPGSLMNIIRQHSSLRLYIDPLLWTPNHIQLLRASISEVCLSQPHRPSCAQCNSCGSVPSGVISLLRSYPYRTEKDRNLTRLIRSTIESFCTSSGRPLFKSSRQCQLPFFVSGKRQCWVTQPLLARDISSGMPLLAFTHESGRCDALEPRLSRFAGTGQVKTGSATIATPISDMNPHDVAVLIAMAQEAQRVQSITHRCRGHPFTPALITPTPNRDALYVYRAFISSQYLESFVDIHKPLDSEMRIVRTRIPFDDTAILLETLGQILDVHRKLDEATASTVISGKENRAQKHTIDEEESRHPFKRQRQSNLPLADIAAPNP